MQLSNKYWVSSKNRRALDFKRMSATTEDWLRRTLYFIVVYYMLFMF